MAETLAIWYSFESTQRELSNEYQHDRVFDGFQKSLCRCALDESSLQVPLASYESSSAEKEVNWVIFKNVICETDIFHWEFKAQKEYKVGCVWMMK